MNLRQHHKALRQLVVISALLLLQACATAPDRTDAYSHFKTGNYQLAEQSISKTMKPGGKNALLYHMEVGLIRHLDQKYQTSNRSLEQAERIIESLYTKSVSGSVGKALLPGAQSKYQGFEFEHVMINYYKALNYIGLAQNNPGKKQDFLDQANVEIRRLNNRLKLIQQRYGDYPDESNAGGIKGIFAKIFGEKINREKLLYRNDAFAQYVSGLIFELNNEIDNARVSYRQAAETYEKGFTEQYQLGKAITEQAWLDTLRIMKIDGAYEDEWPNYVEKKLSASSEKELRQANKKQAELTIIQHLGMAPQRGQLNLQLTAQSWSKSLVLQPIPTGSISDQRAQEAWFKMLYVDDGFFNAMQNFASGGILNVVIGQFTKVYPLGPLWGEAERSGLVDAINSLGGVRIAVPYYKTDQAPFSKTEVWLNGSKITDMRTASSLQKIAYQEQVRNANRQIQSAVITESLKAIAVQKAKEKAEDQWGGFAGALAGIGLKGLQTAAASTDTRNWNTLPAEIRLARIPLKDGENKVELVTYKSNGMQIRQTYMVKATQGNQLWKLRTLASSIDRVSYAPNMKNPARSIAVTSTAAVTETRRLQSPVTPAEMPSKTTRTLAQGSTPTSPGPTPALSPSPAPTPAPAPVSSFSPGPTPGAPSAPGPSVPTPSSVSPAAISAPSPSTSAMSNSTPGTPAPSPVMPGIKAPAPQPVVAAPSVAPAPVSAPPAPAPSPAAIPTPAISASTPTPQPPAPQAQPSPTALPPASKADTTQQKLEAAQQKAEQARQQERAQQAREKAAKLAREKAEAELEAATPTVVVPAASKKTGATNSSGFAPLPLFDENGQAIKPVKETKPEPKKAAPKPQPKPEPKPEPKAPAASGSLEDATPLPLF